MSVTFDVFTSFFLLIVYVYKKFFTFSFFQLNVTKKFQRPHGRSTEGKVEEVKEETMGTLTFWLGEESDELHFSSYFWKYYTG